MNKRFIYTLIFFLFVMATSLLFPLKSDAFTNEQAKVLETAFHYGRLYLDDPEIVQGIAYQETLCGYLKNRKNKHSGHKNIKKQYFGVMQLKLGAFYDVNRFFKLKIKKTDEEIVELLKTDDDFNIYIGTLYIKYLFIYFDKHVDKTILAYNIGLGVVKRNGFKYDPYNYVENVEKAISELIIPFNIKTELY